MVAYVTPAEKNGGILQFSLMMLRETLKMKDAILFLPNSVEKKYYDDLRDNIILYEKIKTVNGSSKKIKNLSEIIIDKKPECVVFLEDSLLMQQLNYILIKKEIGSAVVIHDVVHHPSRNMGYRAILVELLRQIWTKKTVCQKSSIVLLSNNSKDLFDKKYSKRKANLIMMNLGAHVPNCSGIKPNEMPDIRDYYLFFGRIDKYKGIGDLCEAYHALPAEVKEKHKLVIAGNGYFSDLEKILIEKDNDIVVLNRFVDDNEMVWLYEKSKAVVLPYKEASQSGVLPIAYHFLKPVIVSNQKGLLENLENGKTGYFYTSPCEFTDCLLKISFAEFSAEICKYYDKKFDWKKNISNMLEEI